MTLRRKTPIQRTTRVRPRNAKRRRDEFARCYHSAERVEFVQMLPCLGCGSTPSENAHTENGGMSRRADFTTIVPLCHACHHELHQTGQIVRGPDTPRTPGTISLEALRRCAPIIEAAWQQHQGENE